jgi:hypothetical protein
VTIFQRNLAPRIDPALNIHFAERCPASKSRRLA